MPNTNTPYTHSQVNLLQRHIDKKDRQLKQYRLELQTAEYNLDLYKEGLQKTIAKYTKLGTEIERPLEIKLLCSNIVQDAKNLLALADL